MKKVALALGLALFSAVSTSAVAAPIFFFESSGASSGSATFNVLNSENVLASFEPVVAGTPATGFNFSVSPLNQSPAIFSFSSTFGTSSIFLSTGNYQAIFNGPTGFVAELSAVPLPPALPMFAAAVTLLAGIAFFGKKREVA